MKITLGDFVKYLVLLLQKNNIALPFNNLVLFHRLFYRLKKEVNEAKPKFLENLWFDWDGLYSESPELSRFLDAMRCICVETNSPKFDRYWLSEDINNLWQEKFDRIDEATKQYLNLVVHIAREEFKRAV